MWFVKHTKTFRVAVITLLTSFFKSVELLCGENRERLNCSIIRRCGLGVSGGGSWWKNKENTWKQGKHLKTRKGRISSWKNHMEESHGSNWKERWMENSNRWSVITKGPSSVITYDWQDPSSVMRAIDIDRSVQTKEDAN